MRQKTVKAKSSLGSKRGKGKAVGRTTAKTTTRIAKAKRIGKKTAAATAGRKKAKVPRAARTAANLL